MKGNAKRTAVALLLCLGLCLLWLPGIRGLAAQPEEAAVSVPPPAAPEEEAPGGDAPQEAPEAAGSMAPPEVLAPAPGPEEHPVAAPAAPYAAPEPEQWQQEAAASDTLAVQEEPAAPAEEGPVLGVQDAVVLYGVETTGAPPTEAQRALPQVTRVSFSFDTAYLPVGESITQQVLNSGRVNFHHIDKDGNPNKLSTGILLENCETAAFNSSTPGQVMLRCKVLPLSGRLLYLDEKGHSVTALWVGRPIEVYDPAYVNGRTLVSGVTETIAWLYALPRGGDGSQLLDLSADSSVATQPRPSAAAEVVWDWGSFNADTLGYSMLSGTVQFPQSHVYLQNGREAPYVVQRRIFVYEAGMPIMDTLIASVLDNENKPVMIPLGDSDRLDAYAAGVNAWNRVDFWVKGISQEMRLPAQFAPGKVDINKQGRYLPYAFEVLPGFKLEWLSEVGVFVVAEDRVDLTCRYFNSMLPAKLSVEWLYPAQEPELWGLTGAHPDDEGADALWQRLATETDAGKTDWSMYVTNVERKRFRADCENMAPGVYYLQVRHAEGESNILELTVSEEGFESGTWIGGDRDGGDADDKDPPDLEQPVPSSASQPGAAGPAEPVASAAAGSGAMALPEGVGAGKAGTYAKAPAAGGSGSQQAQGPASAAGAAAVPQGAAAVPGAASRPASGGTPAAGPGSGAAGGISGQERVTQTETTISAQRLADMIAQQGEAVLFQKQGLRLTVPAAFLQGLALAGEDMLTVRLLEREPGLYEVGLAVNGESLGALPGARMELWYTPPQGARELGVEGPDGAPAEAVVFDAEEGSLAFAVHATGLYRVTYTLPPAASAAIAAPPAAASRVAEAGGAGGLPVALLLVGVPGAGGLAVWAARGRRGRRGGPGKP